MSRKLRPLSIALLLASTQILYAQKEARFMRFPDVHGDAIVFSYEGDLWRASASGGLAARITSFPGNEYSAKFSPDGESIAFTGSYDGSTNIYVMPVGGGEPKRITY